MLGLETIATIEAILKNKGVAEVKQEKENIVVVEITRKVKDKAPPIRESENS